MTRARVEMPARLAVADFARASTEPAPSREAPPTREPPTPAAQEGISVPPPAVVAVLSMGGGKPKAMVSYMD